MASLCPSLSFLNCSIADRTEAHIVTKSTSLTKAICAGEGCGSARSCKDRWGKGGQPRRMDFGDLMRHRVGAGLTRSTRQKAGHFSEPPILRHVLERNSRNSEWLHATSLSLEVRHLRVNACELKRWRWIDARQSASSSHRRSCAACSRSCAPRFWPGLILIPFGVMAPPDTMKDMASLAFQSSQTKRSVGTIST